MKPWALTDARVWAGPEAGFHAEAIAFGSDGRIGAVGSLAHVLARLPAGSKQVSCGHRLVLPGFVDAHVHVRASAAARLSSDCGDIETSAELLDRLRAMASSQPPGAWISLAGLEPRSLTDGLPSRAQVDAAAGDHPTRARLRSLHGWLLNSAARHVAGVSDGAPDVVPDHTGDVARRLGPVASPQELETAVSQWSEDMLRHGVVALLDATATNGAADVEELHEWHETGVLRQVPAALTADPCPGSAGVKIMPEAGSDLRSRLRDGLRRAWSNGTPAAVHCVDTETLGELIEAVESIPLGQRGELRIEHASLSPDSWLERVAALRPVIVTHPGFIYEHGDRYLSDPELPFPWWLYRVRSWLDRGCRVAIGSDSPAGPFDPLLSLRSAVTRRTASGRVVGPDERITPYEALRSLTACAADSSGLCGFGRIFAGGPGMAVVVTGDLEPATSAAPIQVATVIANGKPVS
jgi:predicted amidohydrolase YtcJ